MSQNPHPLCFMLHVASFGAVLLGFVPLGLILLSSCLSSLDILGTHISDTSIALRTLVHRCMYNSFTKMIRPDLYRSRMFPITMSQEVLTKLDQKTSKFATSCPTCHEMLSNRHSRPFLRRVFSSRVTSAIEPFWLQGWGNLDFPVVNTW